MDLLKQQNHRPTRQFLETIYNHGLIPIITKPTRISHRSSTLIDNILINQKLQDNTNQGIISDNMSDHLPCFALIENLLANKKEDQTFTSRDLRPANIEALKKKLSTGILLPDHDKSVDEQFDRFHETLSNTIDHFLPIVTRKINFKNIRREKWVSPGLLKSIQRCKQLYKQHIKQNKNLNLRRKYIQYNSVLQKTKRLAKKNYYLEQCKLHRSNTKKLWQTVNHVIRKTNN